MFIGAMDSVAAYRKTSPCFSKLCAYSDDIKTFDCTDVRLGNLESGTTPNSLTGN